jgi:hypothetical protein
VPAKRGAPADAAVALSQHDDNTRVQADSAPVMPATIEREGKRKAEGQAGSRRSPQRVGIADPAGESGHQQAAIEAEVKRRGLVHNSVTVKAVVIKPVRKGKDKSGFRGVVWNTRSSKWISQIWIDGKSKSLGTFEASARGEVDAALAYDAAARAAGRPGKANFLPPVRALPCSLGG